MLTGEERHERDEGNRGQAPREGGRKASLIAP
jgi:hypothetical protein